MVMEIRTGKESLRNVAVVGLGRRIVGTVEAAHGAGEGVYDEISMSQHVTDLAPTIMNSNTRNA
jgi:hypothetical protein